MLFSSFGLNLKERKKSSSYPLQRWRHRLHDVSLYVMMSTPHSLLSHGDSTGGWENSREAGERQWRTMASTTLICVL